MIESFLLGLPLWFTAHWYLWVSLVVGAVAVLVCVYSEGYFSLNMLGLFVLAGLLWPLAVFMGVALFMQWFTDGEFPNKPLFRIRKSPK